VGHSTFDDGDFVGREAVEVIDELVDLAVGGVDLALNSRSWRWGRV
jgi:hypothetical protein